MRIGVLGGGQLARMLALAGTPLGLRFVFLDPAPDACARSLGSHLSAEFDDHRALEELAGSVDVITFETENVPADSLELLGRAVRVHPPPRALSIARDRLSEKDLFAQLDIPTPAYAAVDGREDLDRAVGALGLPCVLKTRTMGYDGKGQAVLRRGQDVAEAWERLGGRPLLLEQLVPFEREVSVVAVRTARGETRFWALSENTHREGILRVSRSLVGDRVEPLAQQYAERVARALDHVGVLALELFQVGDALLANEIAPRVHNSGHWTLEGAHTSQFDNHLRAILGWPLGETAVTGQSVMVNFVGTVPRPEEVLAIDHVHLHLYDKEPRPGRKLGHATVHADDDRAVEASLPRLLALAAGS